jgi:hypothetical protein
LGADGAESGCYVGGIGYRWRGWAGAAGTGSGDLVCIRGSVASLTRAGAMLVEGWITVEGRSAGSAVAGRRLSLPLLIGSKGRCWLEVCRLVGLFVDR